MNKLWTVYGLADPRTGWVFYIGISRDVRARLRYHLRDRNSAAHEYCVHIKERGEAAFIVEFGWHGSREIALKQEGALIAVMPLVYNKTHMVEAEAFWAPLRALRMNGVKPSSGKIGERFVNDPLP